MTYFVSSVNQFGTFLAQWPVAQVFLQHPVASNLIIVLMVYLQLVSFLCDGLSETDGLAGEV